MRFVYHVLLLIIYFHTLVHCQGKRGGGGGGGKGGYVVGGAYGGRKTPCETHECRLRRALFGVGLFLAICALWVPIGILYLAYKGCSCKKNTMLVNWEYSEIDRHRVRVYDDNPFQSGIWSTRYFQYGKWHGPHLFPLSFDSYSMKVTGSGLDDVGIFTIDGIYSAETNRIDLTKKYQLGTGNSSENMGHQVTIQLIWNTQNRQFEGKWYVQASIYHDDAKFELKFSRASVKIESDTDGKFHIDSFDPELFNGYVTREAYLQFLSKTDPLLKLLQRYQFLTDICIIPTILLFIAVIAISIFWRMYFDMPGWTYFIVELVIPIYITRKIVNDANFKTKQVTEKLKSTVETLSNTYSKWTLQIDDSKKITLHIDFNLPDQKDVVTTIATTTIDIPESTSLCGSPMTNNADAPDAAASTVISGLDEENIASSVSVLVSSDNKVVLDMQQQSQQQRTS